MFIIPETVPEYSPPMSMGTAHDGPMIVSRKNIAPVKQYTAMRGLAVSAAGRMQLPHPSIPMMATERRANLTLPVLTNRKSVNQPPTASPTTPAPSGRAA